MEACDLSLGSGAGPGSGKGFRVGFGHARAHVGGAHGHHGRATHGPAEDHRPLATLPLPLDLGGDLGVDLGDLGELGRARGRGGGEALLLRLTVGVRDTGARTKARRCWFGLGLEFGSGVLSEARRASSCAAAPRARAASSSAKLRAASASASLQPSTSAAAAWLGLGLELGLGLAEYLGRGRLVRVGRGEG